MDYAENAQATPDGILNNGKLIGFSVVIRSMNDGEYDANFEKGLRLLACVWEAVEKGWYRLSIAKEIIYRGKNGSMSIYPGPERFCLANNIETIAIEEFGTEAGFEKALQIYKSMATTGPECFELSAWGREAFEILHDSFIHELNTKGMPDMPVMH